MTDNNKPFRSSARYRPASLGSKARTSGPDEAARLLVLISRRVLQLAPSAIPRCTHASCTQPELIKRAQEFEGHDHVWRLTGLSRDVLCRIDALSARVLLGWIVGTTPVRDLSGIEQTIITDVLRRLLLAAADCDRLLAAGAPPNSTVHDWWICTLHLSTGGPAAATLQLQAPPDAPAMLGLACQPLGAVVLPLRAAIAGVPSSLDTISSLHPGALLPLFRTHVDLAVKLYAGRRYVAAAQLGAARGSRALKVVSLAASERR
jgi:hypothetical protein